MYENIDKEHARVMERKVITGLHLLEAKKYNLTTQNVVIDGDQYEAVFPKTHGVLEGLLLMLLIRKEMPIAN